MRVFIIINLLAWPVQVLSQVYEEPPWAPPLPPPVEEYCGDIEKVSEPVVSYRISSSCSITDIQGVGEYQYGTAQVKDEVSNLAGKEMIRRLVSGQYVLYNQVEIKLHRALERTATLVCTVDMMGNKVIDAKIIRERVINEDRIIPYEEPVIVENNQLPNLGVFTYTSKIRYKTNNCPEVTR